MKLLFDQNLSPQLAERLADIYPNSTHVFLLGLDREPDKTVWAYARANNYIIVTKDADFSDLGLIQGFPPKVLWLRLGNCTTRQVEMLLRRFYNEILALSSDSSTGILRLQE
jgi:predicted nuclease of predicted toxin-antitoxin system